MPSGCSRSRKRSRRCASPSAISPTGRAVNPPRLRYSASTPDPARRYAANIQAGSVESAGVACVRAGSAFTPVQGPDGRKVNVADDVNYTIVILYDLRTGEPLAFMHETYLSGLRVGATSALAVSLAAREDAEVLGLFGTGMQAMPNCRCHMRGAADQARQGVQPEPRPPRRVRQGDGGREIRDGRGRRSARGGARRACHRLQHQFEGAGAQRRMARARADGRHHRQFGRHRTPATRSTRPPSRAPARSSSTTGTASRPTVRSSCRGRSPRGW